MRKMNYRAVVLTAKGDPDVLQVVDLPDRAPGAGEVRLRVRATGVGGTDVTMRRGSYPFAPPLPFSPGYEVVGDVDAVGTGVTAVSVGQRVAALVVHGGYAERIVVPASALVPVADTLDDAEVAALVLNYVTAYQALHRVAQVAAGQTALVTGASGGVGTAMVELLRVSGVHVIAAASSHAHDALRALDAVTVDSRAPDLVARVRTLAPRGVDASFDNLGGRFPGVCVEATRRGGMVVGVGFSSATDAAGTPRRGAWLRGMAALFVKAPLLGRRGRFYGITLRYRRDQGPFKQDLSTLLALLGARTITPRIHARLPLLEARRANEMLERGGVTGKIVLVNP
jgi:NADPH:quinone reductase-like Zn-dependent oxidoreductase